MWPSGKLSGAITAQKATKIAQLAGLTDERFAKVRFLMVEENGTGPAYPFSGEKLSPVLTVYRAKDFDAACQLVSDIYDFQGAGHSVGIHSADDTNILRLGLELPVSRVIVNQAHCFATGGAFDNGLPFSLSMGCGTWGGNNFSDNMTLPAVHEHHADRPEDSLADANTRRDFRRIPETARCIRALLIDPHERIRKWNPPFENK